MSRNMIQVNRDFFLHIMEHSLSDNVVDCIRYIKTTEEEKQWIKHTQEGKRFKFNKKSFAQLISFNGAVFICIINSKYEPSRPIDNFEYIDVNSGLFTLLGSWGLLHIADGIQSSEIVDKVLYNTDLVNEYSGHEFSDIKNLFVDILCYKVCMSELDIGLNSNSRLFYWIIMNLILQLSVFQNNNYSSETLIAWDKIVYEQSYEKINYKSVLLSYCAMTWDISYLYLYQCLEDAFAENAVAKLHRHLNLEEISSLELSRLLYDELQWRPRDLDAIQSLVDKIEETSSVFEIISKLASDTNPSKWIYMTRNSIVHESRDTYIPLDNDDKWNLAIQCIIQLILES